MKKKIESDLKNIAHKILKMKGSEDITTLQFEAKTLYEKLTVLKFLEAHFSETQPATEKSDAVKKFEELATNVITENTQVPENNPHDEDLVSPLMNTIKDMIAEMPETETLDDILADVRPNPTFVKKEEHIISSSILTKEHVPDSKKRSLNDMLKKGFHIGLNDRIGFVQHLFNGNDEDFDKALAQLNTMTTQTEAISFISNVIKPNYNNWLGKETYETRFLEFIEAKFEA